MSTKDLMARMGHDDMRAALIYQRATAEADEQIAEALSKLVKKHRDGKGKPKNKPGKRSQRRKASGDDSDDGSAGALVPAV